MAYFLNYALKDHIYLAICIFTVLLRDIGYIRKTNYFLLISGHVYRRDSMWNKSLNTNRVYWPLCQSTSQPYVALVLNTTQATVFGNSSRLFHNLHVHQDDSQYFWRNVHDSHRSHEPAMHCRIPGSLFLLNVNLSSCYSTSPVKSFISAAQNRKMFLVSSCNLPNPFWSQVLSQEWRFSWSSANRRCSNCIWLINNFVAYEGAAYIRVLKVFMF